MTGKFWMVWCPARDEPLHKHATEEAAVAEARWIAEKERKTAYVLACIGEAVPLNPPVVWMKYEDWKPAGEYPLTPDTPRCRL
jgi:hypothetical protein